MAASLELGGQIALREPDAPPLSPSLPSPPLSFPSLPFPSTSFTRPLYHALRYGVLARLASDGAQLLLMLLMRHPYREIDFYDFVMNSIGVVAGYALFRMAILLLSRRRRTHATTQGIDDGPRTDAGPVCESGVRIRCVPARHESTSGHELAATNV